jgi:hypothetical protein
MTIKTETTPDGKIVVTLSKCFDKTRGVSDVAEIRNISDGLSRLGFAVKLTTSCEPNSRWLEAALEITEAEDVLKHRAREIEITEGRSFES